MLKDTKANVQVGIWRQRWQFDRGGRLPLRATVFTSVVEIKTEEEKSELL
jgi:hypothetical protein